MSRTTDALTLLIGIYVAACAASPRKSRVSISRDQAFGDVRDELFAAMDSREIEISVGGSTFAIEPPSSSAVDSLATLVVVNVLGSGVEIAGAAMRDATEMDERSRALASATNTLRGEDATSMDRVAETIDGLRRAGAKHVVLGITRPTAALPTWNECPFPAASDDARIDQGVVELSVDLDSRNRAAVVHVVRSSGYGFAGAAALCVARRGFDPASGKTRKLRIRFVRSAPD